MTYVFTIAAVNYLPKVRALCRSLERHHPEFRRVFVLADSEPEWLQIAREPFDELMTLYDLGVHDLHGWLFQHDVVELCTAIKPLCIATLLERDDCDSVLYFDPDVVLFSRLDDLLSELEHSNIALTPHLTEPETDLRAIVDNEICTLKHGIYNLGFLAVRKTAESARFVSWWSERLRHFCRADTADGLFVDQKWIDFVPVFFDDVTMLKSIRFNVAAWNLSTRGVSGDFDVGFKVAESPLGFYHFTGFDDGSHRSMARKYAPGNRAIEALIRWYEGETQSPDDVMPRGSRWKYDDFENRQPILPLHRRLYRDRRDLQVTFPNPFRVNSPTTSYYDWLQGNCREATEA